MKKRNLSAEATDLFISYASEDREFVAAVVEQLEREGWVVWWDQQIEAGTRFDMEIEDAIDHAGCILVVWSEASASSEWVRAEATEGLERNILVQILLDDVRPPLLFRQRQAVSLIDWKKNIQVQPDMALVFDAVKRVLNKEQSSALPVSLQKAWAVAKVIDETRQEVGLGVYESARQALNFLDDVFIYQGSSDDNVAQLVAKEGLDGYIQLRISSDNDQFSMGISLHGTGDEVSFEKHNFSLKHLPQITGELIIRAAPALGEKDSSNDDPIRQFLATLSLDAILRMGQMREHEYRMEYAELKAVVEPLMRDASVPTAALRGYSLACLHLGQIREGIASIKDAVRNLSRESRIEVHRTRGYYYLTATGDQKKAAIELTEVIKMSPMDASALNNLALAKFYLLDFSSARELNDRDRQLYPSATYKLENAALFAFYDGDLDGALAFTAEQQAEQDFRSSVLLPTLMCAIRQGPEAAIQEGQKLNPSALTRAISFDLQIAADDADLLIEQIETAIQLDLEESNHEYAARKALMLAEVVGSDSRPEKVHKALAYSESVETLATAATVLMGCDDPLSSVITKKLKREVGQQARAYARMAEGIALFNQGDVGDAVEVLESALEQLDLWLIRYSLACVYDAAEYEMEMQDQFAVCVERCGEGCFALLDDIPTYRFLHHAKSKIQYLHDA